MFQLHPQRFTVLLGALWGGYMLLYMLLPLKGANIYNYDLLTLTSVTMSGSVVLDFAGLSFSVVVMYISACVFFFSRSYMAGDMFYFRFTWILAAFVASMNILILAGSLFVLLIGWDGLGVSSFALIMYYQSHDSAMASFLTLLVNRLGDIMIMSSMIIFIMSGMSALSIGDPQLACALAFVFGLAALTKSAQYPFCAWLPAAMAAPTPVSALVHSSTLVTAGVYIVIRLCVTSTLPPIVCDGLLFLGGVTSFIGGVCAVRENDLKKLIALSTLSQLGVMMFSLGLGLYSLALLHLFTHAMFKALLFLVAGCILLLSYGVQDIRLLGGLTRANPFLLVCLNVSALCLMGFPFLSAFYSKHLILATMWSYSVNSFSVLLMLASTCLSSVYMVRLLKSLNWGTVHTEVMGPPAMKLSFYTPLIFLFLGSCCLGWVLSVSDVNYMQNVFIDSVYDVLVYLIVLGGIIVGCWGLRSGKSRLLSQMFYMVPVSYNANFLSYFIVRAAKSLDYGWLEPWSFKGSLGFLPSYVSKHHTWSKRTFDFSSYVLLAGGCSVLIWLFLN